MGAIKLNEHHLTQWYGKNPFYAPDSLHGSVILPLPIYYSKDNDDDNEDRGWKAIVGEWVSIPGYAK